jgi:isocitrate dehydrogenase kinase/phosphatase
VLILDRSIAKLIADGHVAYKQDFDRVTRGARKRFEQADWLAVQRTSTQRIELYDKHVRRVVAHIVGEGSTPRRHIDWQRAKASYIELTSGLADREIAETFFNSIHRKLTDDADIDAGAMFVHSAFTEEPEFGIADGFVASYPADTSGVRKLLAELPFTIPWEGLERDVAHIEQALRATGGMCPDARIDVVTELFYRNKGAYVVGVLRSPKGDTPLALPILNNDAGAIYVDTAIVDEDDLSIVFSFTRSYFMVDTPRPLQMVRFLEQLLPAKKRSELYSSIGFHKHGKTEFYRGFIEHLDESEDLFVIAPGVKGMVMTVFTLPSYQSVFKIMRDHFAPQKDVTHEQVRDHYNLVKRHDRVGRMADTQEFSNFSLPRDRFSEELLDELLDVAPSSVRLTEDQVIIRHLYTERLMRPLNLFIEEAESEAVISALDEYGNAIKQLAAANIFPGDMLLKNFGVTRHGRVVFYDYDEICYLTEVNFRHLPQPHTPEQEMASEPWYSVAGNDVFPEEFRRFLFGRSAIKRTFAQLHGELFDPDYWIELQNAVKSQQVMDVFPYRRSQRFPREAR